MKMMHFGPLFAAAMMMSSAAIAAEPKTTTTEKTTQTPMGMEQKKVTKEKTSSGTSKTKEMTVVGTVETYDAAKKLKVKTGKGSKSFDLNDKKMTCTVDPGVTVGTKVKVTEVKDDNGHKTVTVMPFQGDTMEKPMPK